MAYSIPSPLVLDVLSAVAGIYFLVAPLSGRGRLALAWVRLALGTVGVLVLAWSLLGYIENYSHLELSASVRQRLVHGKTLCSGACLGLLFLLFASGELIRTFSRRKSD
jgi:hypothetical protein